MGKHLQCSGSDCSGGHLACRRAGHPARRKNRGQHRGSRDIECSPRDVAQFGRQDAALYDVDSDNDGTSDRLEADDAEIVVVLAALDSKWDEVVLHSSQYLKLDPEATSDIYFYSAVGHYNIEKFDIAEEHARRGARELREDQARRERERLQQLAARAGQRLQQQIQGLRTQLEESARIDQVRAAEIAPHDHAIATDQHVRALAENPQLFRQRLRLGLPPEHSGEFRHQLHGSEVEGVDHGVDGREHKAVPLPAGQDA